MRYEVRFFCYKIKTMHNFNKIILPLLSRQKNTPITRVILLNNIIEKLLFVLYIIIILFKKNIDLKVTTFLTCVLK